MPHLHNTTTNETVSPQSSIDVKQIVESFFLCVLAVSILCGNTLVCMAFQRNRKLRTTTNRFLISLAVADIMVGAFSVPYWVYFRLVSTTSNSTIYKIYITYDTICGTASIANLVMISLERCLSVRFPTIHRNISQGTMFVCVACTWVYAVVVALLDYVKGSKKWYPLFVSNASFLVPLLIIVLAYSIIFKIARYRARRVRAIAREIRIAVTLAVVIMTFVVSWLPFFVVLLVAVYCKHCRLPPIIVPVVKWMQYSGSAVNPIIYTYRNKDFRAAFIKILFPSKRNTYTKTLLENSRKYNLTDHKNFQNGIMEPIIDERSL